LILVKVLQRSTTVASAGCLVRNMSSPVREFSIHEFSCPVTVGTRIDLAVAMAPCWPFCYFAAP